MALTALVGTSCSEFLNVQPEGVPTSTTYFTNDMQAVDAVESMYALFHQEDWYGRDMFWEQGAACDIVWGRDFDFPGLGTFEYSGLEEPIRYTYDYIVKVMARANWTIDALLKKENRTAVEERSLGEAYFCRAWAHYCFAYRYGSDKQGVPFVRWEDFPEGYDNSIPPQRATVMENFQLIIDDMDSAMKHLPRFEEYDQANRGRAHDAACVAFKAKTYAYWATWDDSKWDNVITLVNSLESDYGRELAATFEELFSDDFAHFWNKEYLWTIPGTGGTDGGGVKFTGVVLENKGWGKYNGWGQMKPTEDIYQEMLKDGEGNRRILKSILTYGQEFQYFGKTMKYYSTSEFKVGFQINKYMEAFKYEDPFAEKAVVPADNWICTRINFPIIRFAEMLLFRAEAYMNKGQTDKAAADINKIRVRSGLTPLAGNATWTDLYHERRCELAFEFTDHLYDLKRWYLHSNSEIQQLASKELNSHPQVRFHHNQLDPNSTYTVGDYEGLPKKQTYQEYMMVMPYPPTDVTKSNGKLKQNPGY